MLGMTIGFIHPYDDRPDCFFFFHHMVIVLAKLDTQFGSACRKQKTPVASSMESYT